MTGRTGKLIAALLLGVVLYGLAIAVTGFRAIQQSLVAFEWVFFFAAVLLASTNYLLRFLRWEYYLRRLDIGGVGRFDSLLVFLSGFVLTVTPGKVGEVFKSAVLRSTHGVPLSRTAPIVVAERLADVIGVVVLILCGSSTFAGGFVWAVAGAAFVATGLAVILWERPSDALLTRMAAKEGLARFVPKLREAVRNLRLLSSPTALLWPLSLSVVAWACEGVGLWALLYGFAAPASVLLSVFFYATASLAGALIPVPGGLGVVEAMLRQQLVHLGGVPAATATASMILIRFATLWWAVVVGFAALAILRGRYPGLRRATWPPPGPA